MIRSVIKEIDSSDFYRSVGPGAKFGKRFEKNLMLPEFYWQGYNAAKEGKASQLRFGIEGAEVALETAKTKEKYNVPGADVEVGAAEDALRRARNYKLSYEAGYADGKDAMGSKAASSPWSRLFSGDAYKQEVERINDGVGELINKSPDISNFNESLNFLGELMKFAFGSGTAAFQVADFVQNIRNRSAPEAISEIMDDISDEGEFIRTSRPRRRRSGPYGTKFKGIFHRMTMPPKLETHKLNILNQLKAESDKVSGQDFKDMRILYRMMFVTAGYLNKIVKLVIRDYEEKVPNNAVGLERQLELKKRQIDDKIADIRRKDADAKLGITRYKRPEEEEAPPGGPETFEF